MIKERNTRWLRKTLTVALLYWPQVLWSQYVLPLADPGNSYDYVFRNNAYKPLFSGEGYVLYGEFFNPVFGKQPKHQMVEEVWAKPSGKAGKKLVKRTTYDFDKEGYLVRRSISRNNNNEEATTYSYSQKRRVVTASRVSASGTAKREYLFDSLTLLLKQWRDIDGTSVIDSACFTYDRDNQLESMVRAGVVYAVSTTITEISDTDRISEINYLMPGLKHYTRFQRALAKGGRLTKISWTAADGEIRDNYLFSNKGAIAIMHPRPSRYSFNATRFYAFDGSGSLAAFFSWSTLGRNEENYRKNGELSADTYEAIKKDGQWTTTQVVNGKTYKGNIVEHRQVTTYTYPEQVISIKKL